MGIFAQVATSRKSAAQTLKIVCLMSVFVQIIWIDPTARGFLPFAFSYPSYYIVSYHLFLLTTPLLFIGILRSSAWAWSMSWTLTFSVLFGACVYWWQGSLTPVVALQISAVAICWITLLSGRAIFRAGPKEVLLLGGSLILIVITKFIRGQYFPTGDIDYDRPIPNWLYIWERSFIWREDEVLLLWMFYWGLLPDSGSSIECVRFNDNAVICRSYEV